MNPQSLAFNLSPDDKMPTVMTYNPFSGLPAAYQLHYHFCFQTKFNRSRFSSPEAEQCLNTSLSSICAQNSYHILGHNIEKDRLYCLLSLKPDHVVSGVARTLKSNLSRELNLQFRDLREEDGSLWSIGYYVGSIGKASKLAAERYIDKQGEHHCVRSTEDREIMRWVNSNPPALRAAHVTFDLNYHVVFVTSRRASIFDRHIAPHFFNAMNELSAANGFYIEKISLLYDHMHALVKLTPSHNIQESIENMMNHSWRFMMDRYEGVLNNTGAYNVWTESFYVSTVGNATTAQIKSFLSRSG